MNKIVAPTWGNNSMGWTKHAMNLIVAARKSTSKKLSGMRVEVIQKRPTGSQAIDILIKIAEYVETKEFCY